MALSSKRNINRNQGVNQMDFEKVIIGDATLYRGDSTELLNAGVLWVVRRRLSKNWRKSSLATWRHIRY
jgi:hypothetical protein